MDFFLSFSGLLLGQVLFPPHQPCYFILVHAFQCSSYIIYMLEHMFLHCTYLYLLFFNISLYYVDFPFPFYFYNFNFPFIFNYSLINYFLDHFYFLFFLLHEMFYVVLIVTLKCSVKYSRSFLIVFISIHGVFLQCSYSTLEIFDHVFWVININILDVPCLLST